MDDEQASSVAVPSLPQIAYRDSELTTGEDARSSSGAGAPGRPGGADRNHAKAKAAADPS